MSAMTDLEFYGLWLKKYIGDFELVEKESGEYSAEFSDVFYLDKKIVDSERGNNEEFNEDDDIDPGYFMEMMMRQLMGNGPDLYQSVVPIAATGETPLQTLQALFDEVMEKSQQNIDPDESNLGKLKKLKLKVGQDRGELSRIINEQAFCKTIRHDDPEHSHENHDLLDFGSLEIDHFNLTSEEEDYEYNHSHILVAE